MPAAKGAVAKGEIWLCPITKDVPVAIGKGENSGHTDHLSQRGAALDQARRVDRRGAHLHGPAARRRRGVGADAVAVVVQAGSKEAPGTMLGATVASLQ